MARADKREDKKLIQSIAKKAKKQMIDWVDALGYTPTESEIRAWQAGYISGLNQRNQSL
jgi:Mn-containing catalase